MTMKPSNSWGLVVPGRPPTPSEGHAQIFARDGNASTQRLIAFENGTCLTFGPEDLVDEFGPGDAFAEQVAMVDKAVRDCQSITQRYAPTGDDENRAYDGFRTKPLDLAKLVKVPHPDGVQFQIPSKFASVGTIIPVYAGKRKNDIPGEAHPGSSVDTRFGITGQLSQAGHQLMRGETERDRGLGVREEDEDKRRHRSLQHKGRGGRQIRRGRRLGREIIPAENYKQQESTMDGEAHHVTRDMRETQSIGSTTSQAPFYGYSQTYHNLSKQKRYAQNLIQQPHYGQTPNHSHQHGHDQSQRRGVPQYSHSPRTVPPFASQHSDEFGLLSALPSPPGRFETESNPNGAPSFEHIKHMKDQVMANAREALLEERRVLNTIPDGYHSNSEVSNYDEVIKYYYTQGLDQYFESENAYLKEYFRQERERSNEEILHREEEKRLQYAGYESLQYEETTDQTYLNSQVPRYSYTQPHYQTAQRANYELARYADDLNRQAPHPKAGRLRGDTFVGAPTFPVQVTSPDGHIVATMAHHQALLDRAQNTQSIGSRSGASGRRSVDFSHFGNYIQSTRSSESGAISDDNSTDRGRSLPSESARAQAADERRGNSGGQHISQPRQGLQINNAILAPSGTGIYSRDPSPVAARSRFFDSRRSSPGGLRPHVHGQGRSHGAFDRSASAGNY